MAQKSLRTLKSATAPATQSVTLLASRSPASTWLENGDANRRTSGKIDAPAPKSFVVPGHMIVRNQEM